MVATLAIGLVVDAPTGIVGQVLVGIAFWAVLFYVLGLVTPRERQAAIACLVVATGGEMFLSLVWGVYTYRLHNVPLFVPPGHVMMFLLGATLAHRMSERVAWAVAIGTAIYAIVATATRFDTLTIPMFLALAIPWLVLPRERRLLACTYLLALALELYGTRLGTWTWSHDVPYTNLVTTNPPGLSGTLYSFRDALVPAVVLLLKRSEAAAAPALSVSRSV